MNDWLPVNALLTILLAGGLGGIIGLERELAAKPAGLRTHILVAMAAALLVVLGMNIVEDFRSQAAGSSLDADPIRVMQSIVIGISFLGAGTIIRDRSGDIEGLTTAASILMAAALGIAAAVGEWALGLTTALLTVIVLGALGWMERRVRRSAAGGDAR